MTRAANVARPGARIDTATLMRGCRRFVVVAPHPDDETLGVGGVLATLARAATPMLLVAVTDGEGSHAHGDWWTPARLRAARPCESLEALRELGWQRPAIQRLRFTDSAVAADESALTRRLQGLLGADDCVATTWQRDGHPDHEATARAVLAAAARIGCTCIQFPIWRQARLLDGRAALPPRQVRRFALDAEAVRRKRCALGAYRSQLRPDPVSGAPPIVPMALQRHALRGVEILVLP